MDYYSAIKRNDTGCRMAKLCKHYAVKKPDTKIARISRLYVYEMPRIGISRGTESRIVAA